MSKLTIPPLADNAEYREAAAKLDSLRLKLNEARAHASELNERRSDETHERRRRAIHANAHALVGAGAAIDDEPPMLWPGLAAARDRVAGLELAVTMQEATVNTLVNRLSREACETVAAEHRKRLNRLARALKECGDANGAEAELRGQLREAGYQGVEGYLQVGYIHAIGDPEDTTSNVSRWLADLADQTARRD